MAVDVPTPDELSDRLSKAINKGIDLHPDWSINHLFPPSDVVFKLVYPEEYMKLWVAALQRDGGTPNKDVVFRIRSADYANRTNEELSEYDKSNLEKWSVNDYITKYLEGVLNAETTTLTFDKNWKWVSGYAIQKALDMRYAIYAFGAKDDELEAIENYNVASADLTQKAWEHFLNRFVWEQDGKYWLVRISDFSIGPPETAKGVNVRSFVPSESGKKSFQKEINTLEDLEEAINMESIEVEVFMWWEKPQVRWRMEDEENTPFSHGRKSSPRDLQLFGEGVRWDISPYYMGNTVQSHHMRNGGNVWYQPQNFNFSSALEAIMISPHSDLSFAFYETNGANPLFPKYMGDSDNPSVIKEFKKRQGFPLKLASDSPSSGYSYILARGNEVPFINREFMW